MSDPFHKILADDPDDRRLADNTHPPGWVNPAPAGRYDLVVIGGGTAGLVAAAGAAFLGARVALVERGFTGGDCLVTGCVPSKALIRSARAAFDAADAGRFGLRVPAGAEADFPAVMRRLRRRADVSPHDAAARFRDEWGVQVFFGRARFVAPDAVEVTAADYGGAARPVRLAFRRAILATGSRPAIPDVPGLREAGFRTNEDVFNLTERPARLAVVGGGPVGCELAQAFARLGSKVTLLQSGPRLLPRDDEEAAAVVARVLAREGVDVRLNTSLRRVEPGSDAARRLTLAAAGGGEATINADVILVAAGRAPNVEELGLESAGVQPGRHGVEVDDYLRTSNRRVYAAGDVCLPYRFTHTADASARVAVQNALLPFRKRVSRLVVPWCTYTDPEVAHVGLGEAEARAGGMKVRTIRVPMDQVDRAITDGETEGFLKVHLKARTDRILGATLVSRHAGETISQITTAMAGRVGLRKLAGVIFPYPTQAEVIRAAADEFYREGFGPFTRGLLRRLVRR